MISEQHILAFNGFIEEFDALLFEISSNSCNMGWIPLSIETQMNWWVGGAFLAIPTIVATAFLALEAALACMVVIPIGFCVDLITYNDGLWDAGLMIGRMALLSLLYCTVSLANLGTVGVGLPLVRLVAPRIF